MAFIVTTSTSTDTDQTAYLTSIEAQERIYWGARNRRRPGDRYTPDAEIRHALESNGTITLPDATEIKIQSVTEVELREEMWEEGYHRAADEASLEDLVAAFNEMHP